MFTGLVQQVGRLGSLSRAAGGGAGYAPAAGCGAGAGMPSAGEEAPSFSMRQPLRSV